MTNFARCLSALAFALLWPVGALAHGPTPQKAAETIAISAPPEKVWAVIKDFATFADWQPAVAKCDGEGGNATGATRTFTLKSGGVLSESLDDYSDKDMYYAYRLDKENIEAFPVSSYSAKIKVSPAAGGGSEVEWSGRFYRGDTNNDPPANLNDEAAVKAMTDFLRAGLEGLKAKFGAKG